MTVRIVLNLTENWPAVAGIAATLSEAAKAALRTTPEPPSGEIGITFVTDVVMRELNLRYLGRSGTAMCTSLPRWPRARRPSWESPKKRSSCVLWCTASCTCSDMTIPRETIATLPRCSGFRRSWLAA